MESLRGALVLVVISLASMASSEVAARGGHGGGHSGGHSGGHAAASGSSSGHRFHPHVFAGAGLFAPFYLYPPPPPYYGSPPEGSLLFWYFCPSLGAYYPYVGECPEGWQQVLPQPPS